MPRGGSRPGSGRKPWKKPAMVVGMDGVERHPVAAQLPPVDLLRPPADLSAVRQAHWTAYAPMAVAEGTLIPSRVLGFRQFVAQLEMVETLDLAIHSPKTEASAAADAMKTYVKLAQRLDATMARFKLTSFGKSEAPAKAAAPVNPWGSIGKATGT